MANYYDQFYTGVDFGKVNMIESSGNPFAHAKKTDARGLGQITPIALKDWNQENPNDQYAPNDLWDPQINNKIAYWTLTQRIPSMLQAYKKPVTPENILWAYHDGIGNVRKGYMSDAAKQYLIKYFSK